MDDIFSDTVRNRKYLNILLLFVTMTLIITSNTIVISVLFYLTMLKDNQINSLTSNPSNRNFALLVIDLQNDFIDPKGSLPIPQTKSNLQSLENAKNKIQRYRENNNTIMFTRDTHFDNDPEFEIFGRHCIFGTWGWELISDIASRDIIINKPRYDSFISSQLLNFLNTYNIGELEIIGAVGEICVNYVAVGAWMRGFKGSIDLSSVVWFSEANQNFFIENLQNITNIEINY